MNKQKHNVTAEVEEIIEKIKHNKNFAGSEPQYQFFETLCAGTTCGTRLTSDGEALLLTTLTKLIADTEKKRDEELIAWIETECMYDDLIIKNQLLAHLKEK